MKVESINVSQPVKIEYKGKKLETGIFKKPIAGPVYVSKLNVQGDRQVDLKNHGGEHKAVYAFSLEHYAYWQKVLERKSMRPGIFGENLTISGLDESDMHIGDQLKIGDCVLEITQPRVPCFKLGIALQNADMPRLFTEHFSTGIYLRVIEEGKINVGDSLDMLMPGKNQVSVKDLFRAYFDKNFPSPEKIFQLALDIPELSMEWRNKLETRLTQS